MASREEILIAIEGRDESKAAFQSAIKNEQRLRQEGKALSTNMRQLRGMSGQLGHQLQDVAVQAQMGTNAFVILGQQGSQVAAIFGPGGALFGAVIAIGSALAMAFMPSVMDSKDASEQLEKALESLGAVMEKDTATGAYVLSDAFIELAGSSRELAEVQLIGKQVAALNAVQTAQRQLRESTEELIFTQHQTGNAVRGNENIMMRFATEMGVTSDQAYQLREASLAVQQGVEGADMKLVGLIQSLHETGAGSEEFLKLIDPIVQSVISMQDAQRQAEFLEEAMANLSETLANSNSDYGKRQEAIEKLIGKLELESTTLGYNETAVILYTNALQGASFEQLRQIALLRQKIDAYEAEQEAARQAAETQRELERDQDRATKDVDRLQYQLLTEEEQLVESYKRRQEIIDNALELQVINEQQAAQLRADLNIDQAERIHDAERKLTEQRLKSAEDFTKQIEGFAERGSKAQKAAVMAQKGIALVEAAINLQRAIAQANAVPFPANLIEIARASAVGMGAIASIKAASFEGGGITFNGARSGGLDGKGGRMAMVHPNEKITDLEKNGNNGGGDTINVTIQANDAKSFKQMLADDPDFIVSMLNQRLREQGKAPFA